MQFAATPNVHLATSRLLALIAAVLVAITITAAGILVWEQRDRAVADARSALIGVSALAAVSCSLLLLCVIVVQFRRIEDSRTSLGERNLALEETRARLERQAAELIASTEALARSEKRFRDFAEITSEWFWEQNADLRYTWFSDSVNRPGLVFNLLGMTRWEMVTEGVSEARWAEHRAELAARKPFRDFRYIRTGDDGAVHHISVSGAPVFDEAGAFIGYRGAGREITAQIRAEEGLIQAKEAAEAAKLEVQAANLQLEERVVQRTTELLAAQGELVKKERLSAIGQLTATVAHELRNPLSAIRNTIFTVKALAGDQGSSFARPLARLERSIDRCEQIVAELLDFTRTTELKRSRFPLDPWVGEVLDEHKLPSEIELVRRLDAPGLVVALDRERFRRVLVNLLDNAAQAIESGTDGQRQIVVATIAVPVAAITIEDTGPGIDPELMPKIFEPLFSTKNFGTGLGLPTVKQIVEQHGGAIRVESRLGRGTTVRIELPDAPAASLAA